MNIQSHTAFLINSSGFFDFDLTFLIEALFFLLLACATTFFFINPISNILDLRTAYLEFNLRKSALLIRLGSENLSTLLSLLLEETGEMARQTEVGKHSLDLCLENEIKIVQKENYALLKNLQGNLFKKSAHAFSITAEDINLCISNYFTQRFYSENAF